LLLGIPFAYGIRVLNERSPALIPWAWAINGCFSVVGSILTVVISMTLGFSAVLCIAALIYTSAFWALRRETTV
jgi:ABC-type Mn2+/Zn2+ transport system permease subunit